MSMAIVPYAAKSLANVGVRRAGKLAQVNVGGKLAQIADAFIGAPNAPAYTGTRSFNFSGKFNTPNFTAGMSGGGGGGGGGGGWGSRLVNAVSGFALRNQRATMAIAGGIAGGITGGWEGAALGAGAGALTPRKFSQLGGSGARKALGDYSIRAQGLGAIVGGTLAPGFGMGLLGGGAALVGKAAIGSLKSNARGMNKPYSTMGSSYGASMGGAPYGSSFSGMGMRY